MTSTSRKASFLGQLGDAGGTLKMNVAPGLLPCAEHCGADKAPVAYCRGTICTQVSRVLLTLSWMFAAIPVMAEVPGLCLSGDISHELLNTTSPTAPRDAAKQR